MRKEARVVCVSGGSGYVASWLVKVLLRNVVTMSKHPLETQMIQENYNIYSVLMELRKGYTCSKQTYRKKGLSIHWWRVAKAELIEPAVKGTLNVLKSCLKVPSIKRVVLTSSMSAVLFNGKSLSPEAVVDETWYSDTAVCEQLKLWYSLSKTLAEDAAWKFSKANGINMVSLNPGLVIGPLLQPTLNTSVEPILYLINGHMVDAGSEVFPNVTYRWVDVRDVARAHINAFEDSSANGRYCLVGTMIHCSEVLKILQELYPDLGLPKKCADNEPFSPICQVSKIRAESLGVKFTPVEVSLKDTIESLK